MLGWFLCLRLVNLICIFVFGCQENERKSENVPTFLFFQSLKIEKVIFSNKKKINLNANIAFLNIYSKI